MPGMSAYIMFLDGVHCEILGSRVADSFDVDLSTNEIDLNMGLDIGLYKICDHMTGGHTFVSL